MTLNGQLRRANLICDEGDNPRHDGQKQCPPCHHQTGEGDSVGDSGADVESQDCADDRSEKDHKERYRS